MIAEAAAIAPRIFFRLLIVSPSNVFLDHPIGVVGMSIKHQALETQRTCEMVYDRLPFTRMSSSAKADDPLRRGASVLSLMAANTGCPACAGHDGCVIRATKPPIASPHVA